MRTTMIAFMLLAGCMLLFAGPRLNPDPENLPNLQEPRYLILTAGQPTETGFREIASMGVKTVINVLPERECWTGEATVVQANNMTYVALPFETTGFKMETIRKFAALLENQEKPILVHCSTGNHVGGLWFAYRVLIEKAPLATGLKEGRSIGLTRALEDSIINWVMDERDNLRAAENVGS